MLILVTLNGDSHLEPGIISCKRGVTRIFFATFLRSRGSNNKRLFHGNEAWPTCTPTTWTQGHKTTKQVTSYNITPEKTWDNNRTRKRHEKWSEWWRETNKRVTSSYAPSKHVQSGFRYNTGDGWMDGSKMTISTSEPEQREHEDSGKKMFKHKKSKVKDGRWNKWHMLRSCLCNS